MFPLVTFITKRFWQVKLSLNSQGWLSFATQVASSENKSEKKKAVNGVRGRCGSKTTEVSCVSSNILYPFFTEGLSPYFYFLLLTQRQRPKQIAFVTSKVDYCNSLLCVLPKYQLSKSQRVLNC